MEKMAMIIKKNLYRIGGIFMKKYILITDIIGVVGSLIIFILSIIWESYLWAIVILGIICLIWVFKLIYYYKNYILLKNDSL